MQELNIKAFYHYPFCILSLYLFSIFYLFIVLVCKKYMLHYFREIIIPKLGIFMAKKLL